MGHLSRLVCLVNVYMFFISVFGYAQQSQIDSITNILTEKELFAAEYQKDTSYINSLNALAYQYVPVHVDSTYLMADRALKLSESLGYDNGIANSFLHIGIYHSEKGKSDKAIETYDKALIFAQKGNNLDLLFDINNNRGIERYLRGEFDKSLEVHLQNLDLAKIQNDPKNISYANANIAILFDIQGEHGVALPYYEQALTAAKRSYDNYSIGVAMLNLSNEYAESRMTEKAYKQIKDTKSFLKEHGHFFLLGELYLYEGRFLYEMQEYDLAYKAVQKSIELLNDANNSQINFAVRYQIMADVLLKQKEYAKAVDFAEKAYEIAKNTNDLKGIAYASETLYKYHKSMGEVTETLKYLEEFKKHSDSLFNSQNKNGILLLKAKSDFDKKQSELEAENEKILLTKQNKINTSLLIIIILIATLIPLFLKHRKLGFLNHSVTEKSKLLEKREKELIKSNNTKDKLFSIIGHDLKGPIDSLRLLLSMHQKKEVSDEEFLEFSPKLNKDVSSVFFTLTNLLNWGKSQMKGEVVQKRNFAVKPLVRDVMDFLESTSISKQLKLVNETEGEVEVYADRNQIDVVIRNILSNAIKFTPAKGTIKVISQDFENKYRISIMDNGIGMDPKTSERVLDPNETYTTYGTDNEKGTGLGLILCKELVEKNKGEIWVESTLGKGSTFHILLPKTKGPVEILKAV